MASIAEKTADVPGHRLLIGIAKQRRRHPSPPFRNRPGFFRSTGTSPGLIRNSAYPITSPATARLAAAVSTALDAKSLHCSIRHTESPSLATPRVPDHDHIWEFGHTAQFADCAQKWRTPSEIAVYPIGNDWIEPPWRSESIFRIMLISIATSRERCGAGQAKTAFASRECMVPLDASWAEFAT